MKHSNYLYLYLFMSLVGMASLSQADVILGPNLMTHYNPGFESPDNGNWYWVWDYWNGSGFETVTDDVHSGQRAFKADEDTEWISHNYEGLDSLDPLKTYQFSCWAKVVGFQPGDYPRVGYYDVSNGNQPWNHYFTSDTEGWIQITHTFTGTSFVRPYVQWNGADSSSSYLLVDDFAFREVTDVIPEGYVSYVFEDTGQALRNPGMGWVYHYYDNGPNGYHGWLVGGQYGSLEDQLDAFPGMTTIYMRLAWSFFEPTEGNYDWSLLDNVVDFYTSRGYRVAFRFTCFESHDDQAYATPQWVEDAGALFRPKTWPESWGGNTTYEPDYTDPVFLEKHQNFISAVAAKYNGDPNVDFIDVGAVGVWGEGNSNITHSYSYEELTPIIDMYATTFPDTLIALNDDFGSELKDSLVPYGLNTKGMTLRDDSILYVPYYQSDWMADLVWQDRPVILESDHFTGSFDRGVWGDGQGYIDAMEAYHASYVSCHTSPYLFMNGWDVYPSQADLVDRINLRLGYRLMVDGVYWPQTGLVGQDLPLGTIWRNVGVAPCFPGGNPIFILKNSAGQIESIYVDTGFDVKDLDVGPSAENAPRFVRDINMPIPDSLPGGTYTLSVAVGNQGEPELALPLPATTGNREYLLGELNLLDACSMDLNSDGDVNLYEFSVMASDWLVPNAPGQGDFTGDGNVDMDDLEILIYFWLSECSS